MKKLPTCLLFLFLSFNIYSQMPIYEEEITGVYLINEELKFASDLYISIYEYWDIDILKTLSEGKQPHIERIKKVLEIYEIEDPLKDKERGEFVSPFFSDRYEHLLANSDKSIVDSLYVCATIEDMIINDLNGLLAATDNVNLIAVYSNLKYESINHIRILNRALKEYNKKYIPQYTDPEELNSLLF